MKLKIYALIVCLALGQSMIQKSQAQSFRKGGIYTSLGLGVGQLFHVPSSNSSLSSVWSITGQLKFQTEFGIHKYVGLGFQVGAGVGSRWPGFAELNGPVGMMANFHFYQLIDDKSGKDLHSDKLDIYAGLSLGTGLAFYPDFNEVNPLLYFGPHVGVRYYFTKKFGLNAEIGHGSTIVMGGIVFRLKHTD